MGTEKGVSVSAQSPIVSLPGTNSQYSYEHYKSIAWHIHMAYEAQ